MKQKLPEFRKGDVLVRINKRKALDGTVITSLTDQITLLEDTNAAEAARVRTPAEGTLLVKVEYIGERKKVDHRWNVPITHGQMDNAFIVRNYELKDGNPSLF